MSNQEVISAPAAAAIAGIHSVTMYQWIKEGKVAVERDGRNLKVIKASLDKYLAARGGSAIAEPALEKARAIVAGSEDDAGDEEDPEIPSEEEVEAEEPADPDAYDDTDLTEESVKLAKKLVDHAAVMRRKRRREAELELLWLAVRELKFAGPEDDGPRLGRPPREDAF